MRPPSDGGLKRIKNKDLWSLPSFRIVGNFFFLCSSTFLRVLKYLLLTSTSSIIIDIFYTYITLKRTKKSIASFSLSSTVFMALTIHWFFSSIRTKGQTILIEWIKYVKVSPRRIFLQMQIIYYTTFEHLLKKHNCRFCY